MSDAKLAANRENAKRSTGPKTMEGKATSARNATKHGALATVPVLPCEEATEWEAHLDGISEALKPVGYHEELLTFRYALQLWRLRRIVRYEVEHSQKFFGEPYYRTETALPVPLSKIDCLVRYEVACDRLAAATLAEFRRVQAERIAATPLEETITLLASEA